MHLAREAALREHGRDVSSNTRLLSLSVARQFGIITGHAFISYVICPSKHPARCAAPVCVSVCLFPPGTCGPCATALCRHLQSKLATPQRMVGDQEVLQSGYVRVHVHPKRSPMCYMVDWKVRPVESQAAPTSINRGRHV
jgi:hypothetical protein